MAGQGGSKSNEKNRNNAAAGRMAWSRDKVFKLEGFKSNEPVPSVSAARKMARHNLTVLDSQRPQPRLGK